MISRIWLSVALIALPSHIAMAQNFPLVCPKLSPEMRSQVAKRMLQRANKGGYVGCAPRRKEDPPDFECQFAQTFSSESNTAPRTLGFPWPFIVGCFPELGPVKSLNEKALAAKEIEEVRKTEAAEKAARERQAQADAPKHLLTRTYYDYIQVKVCFEKRKGYVSANISSAEMERAKVAAKALETFTLAKDPTLNKEQLWSLAASDSKEWMIEGEDTEIQMLNYDNSFKLDLTDRSRCQNTLSVLETRAKRLVPSSAAVEKDF